jgi:hypothetical protein
MQKLLAVQAALQQERADLPARQERILFLPTAQLSFDIQQSVPVSEALLFGALRIP